jgi:hypothetical protein
MGKQGGLLKRFILAASVAVVVSVGATPGTASACDPNSPTCGSGNVVENVVNWTEWRVREIGEFVKPILDGFECGGEPNVCP